LLSELWQQQLQIIEDTTMPITTCTRDEKENDSVGIRSPLAISPMNDHTEEEHHHLWWGDCDHVAAAAADEEDHLNDTLPLFALNFEDTTTTSGVSEQRSHDSDISMRRISMWTFLVRAWMIFWRSTMITMIGF
jgi:hypothetical protein